MVQTAKKKTFHLGFKNQSVYAVSGASRCLFSDKYKTRKSLQLLNVKRVGKSRNH
jgi:glutathione peroxidase-family protein